MWPSTLAQRGRKDRIVAVLACGLDRSACREKRLLAPLGLKRNDAFGMEALRKRRVDYPQAPGERRWGVPLSVRALRGAAGVTSQLLFAAIWPLLDSGGPLVGTHAGLH